MESIILESIKTDLQLKLPARIENSEDFNDYRSDLESKFDQFKAILKKVSTENNVDCFIHKKKAKINKICDLLLKCIDEYLSGNRSKAYKIIEQIFKQPIIKEHIRELTDTLKTNTNFYRVRCDKNIKDKKDNFHIKFNERHMVGAQRYSVPGLPCLYLGSSIYLCWKEMGEPDLNSLYISRYVTVIDSLKVLNFAFNREIKFTVNDCLFKDTERIDEDRSKARIIFYPILLACSYERKEKDAKFHIEYCIPNLIMEWILNSEDFDGIAFFSTKMDNSELSVNYAFPANYAPPATEVPKYDFCPELRIKFQSSDPVSWQILTSVKRDGAPQKPPAQIIGEDSKDHEIPNAKYSDTIFGTASKNLNEYVLGFVESKQS